MAFGYDEVVSVTTLLRAPMFRRGRRVAREWTDTHVERPVARGLAVGSSLRRGTGKVVYFGESSLVHISPTDTDRRRLGEMLAGAADTNIAQYYGPGYSAALHAEMARLMVDLPRPRCVVVSLLIRATTHRHVTDHPVFGYRTAIAALRSASKINAHLLSKLYKAPASEADYARFEAIERDSYWGWANTIGEYRRRLRGYDPHSADENLQAILFDYFHGEYSAASPGLQDWRSFGERLRMLGVPVVAYRTYMPLERGARLFGDDFVAHVEQNFSLVEESFFAGLGGGESVQIGLLPDSLYVSSTDATEHLNENGRRRVVGALLPAVQARLA